MTKQERATYMREYRKRAKWKEWEKEYSRKYRVNMSPDQKKRRRLTVRKWRERNKEHVRAYNQRPEVKTRQRLWRKKTTVKLAKKLYNHKHHKEYYQRPEVKQRRSRPEVKLAKKLYDQQYHKEYYQRPEVKLQRKFYYAKIRRRTRKE